ncbi:OmpP1/FadL family transporter [Aurantibacter aestuarii]|uniref:Transporter n=1 Tax=Aurantibacter aestuarii TaxID=1266046 RepID=A0A2T1NA72_9FLAO|nr:outer membrane protein transport protein [Aurantibacter aestuarii]PSG88760.1 transporter [Aurantibacter aestuarii]
MKKITILLFALFTGVLVNAQDINDAVRYSNTSIEGSARFRAMSGAFGALGGDLSAVNVNPAGSAVFNNSFASFTLNSNRNTSETNYFGEFNTRKSNTIDLSQVGGVFIFRNYKEGAKFKKFSLSLAYDQIGNFENEWNATGTNGNNTIGNYFLNYAQGLRLDEISAFPGESTGDAYTEIGNAFGFDHQQAFLGYDSFILEPDTFDDDNTGYTSNISGGNYRQQYAYNSTGYNGKLAFNAATQYNDNIYFGLNLNSHFLNFEKRTFLFESNNNDGSIVKQAVFENTLRTIGTGFSFQLGTIAKVTDGLRVGLSYESPTWYTLEDETTQYVETLRDDGGENVVKITDPNVITLFPTYRLQTPAKLTSSFAYVFGEKGLISLDYSVKDYSKTKFKPENETYFSDLNQFMSNTLTTATSLRLGGEYIINQFSLRGGYRYEQSPYEDDEIVGDLTGFSLGLGYNFGNTKLDLAYDRAQQDRNQSLYNVGLTDRANINNTTSNITLTLGFNL